MIFAIAVMHTFLTKYFERLAHIYPKHGGAFHFLGEVEVVFGLWAVVLMVVMVAMQGSQTTLAYLNALKFTEPLFVFVIMIVAASRPILSKMEGTALVVARAMPMNSRMALMFILLFLVPLTGSFITEPAAMTLAALLLRDTLFDRRSSHWLRYSTLGVLFVNISIGGVLTPYAAPPVLMVATKWNLDITYLLTHIGWRSAIACFVNAAALVWVFRKELAQHPLVALNHAKSIPWSVFLVHALFLFGVVWFAHHSVVFLGLFLFFLGYTIAYKTHQSPLIFREALMVAFFLCGLVVLGGLQDWWLRPTLQSMDGSTVYYGATLLTAVTDNAALTYLASLVEGLSDEFKLSLLMGAVSGGGLTLIANAPNPAGAAILKVKFSDQSISVKDLFLAACLPTLTTVVCMRFI